MEPNTLRRDLTLLLRANGVLPAVDDALTFQGNNQAEWQDLSGLFLPRDEWLQNGFVSRTDNALTFVNGTRTFTVAPTGANFDYYHDGVRNTTTGDSIVITNVDGVHWLYYNDGTGTLVEIVNPTHTQHEDLTEDECQVGMVYWNTNTSEGYLFDGRHGYMMSPVTHRVLHEALGVLWARGIAIVDITTDQAGNNDTHSQFGNASGEVYDQDVEHIINAIAGGGTYECWWWDGTRWQWDTNAGYPFLVGGTPQPQYNNFGAGTLVEGGNNNFVLTHLFASSAEDGNCIIIVGQAVYGTANAAREGAATEISDLLVGNLPGDELKPIATVILGIRNAYTNTNNCITVSAEGGHDYLDWRSNPVSPGGGTVTDHGSLADLIADDHHQYLLLAGRAGGQIAIGGTAAGEDLTLQSTAHATRGSVIFGLAGTSVYDEVNDKIGIGTAVIPHGAVGYARLALEGADQDADGPHIQLTTATDDYPLIQVLGWRHDSCGVIYDAYYDGAWKSSDAGSSFALYKANDVLQMRWDVAAAGAAVTWNTGLALDAVGNVGVGTLAMTASTKLEVLSTTGAFLVSRMTAAQRGALAGLDGMVVYQTDAPIGWYFHDNGGWVIGSALT